MKKIDERETRNVNTKNKKKTKTKRTSGVKSYSESNKDKWFCCAFNLGFLQLICKTSLIFNSNL